MIATELVDAPSTARGGSAARWLEIGAHPQIKRTGNESAPFSRAQVYQWVREGRVRRLTTGKKGWRFRVPADIEAELERTSMT